MSSSLASRRGGARYLVGMDQCLPNQKEERSQTHPVLTQHLKHSPVKEQMLKSAAHGEAPTLYEETAPKYEQVFPFIKHSNIT